MPVPKLRRLPPERLPAWCQRCLRKLTAFSYETPGMSGRPQCNHCARQACRRYRKKVPTE
jgi:hypothetical protein